MCRAENDSVGRALRVRVLVVLGLTGLAAPSAAEPLKLVVPEFRVVGLAPGKASFLSEHLSNRFARTGVSVTTARAIEQILGMERQRQMLGCSKESDSCTAEIAASLGADALVLGDVATIGAQLQLNLKIVSAKSGDVLSLLDARLSGEEALLDALDDAAFTLASEASVALKKDAPKRLGGSSSRVPAVVAFGAGAAFGVASAVLFSTAADRARQIPQLPTDPPKPEQEVLKLAAEGKSAQTAAAVCAGLAVAGVVAGGVLWLRAGSAPGVTASLWLGPNGAAVVVGGHF